MNRTIKLRVWDKIRKQFIEPIKFYSNTYTENAEPGEALIDFDGQLRIAYYPCGNGDNSANSVFSPIEKQDNYIIHQFTGLLDKNNKEIFEGDLLKRIGDSLDNFFEVYWNVQAAKFNTRVIQKHNKLIAIMPVPADGFHDLEVVGNIYENPELIYE